MKHPQKCGRYASVAISVSVVRVGGRKGRGVTSSDESVAVVGSAVHTRPGDQTVQRHQIERWLISVARPVVLTSAAAWALPTAVTSAAMSSSLPDSASPSSFSVSKAGPCAVNQVADLGVGVGVGGRKSGGIASCNCSGSRRVRLQRIQAGAQSVVSTFTDVGF